jgi:hypothetical protein
MTPSLTSCAATNSPPAVYGKLMEISDEWETGRAYLRFEKENA